MRLELFVAVRYLRAQRKQAVISVVTLISVIGVAAGVASLNVALSLNAGFQKEFKNRILGVTSHVNLFQLGRGPLSEYRRLQEKTGKIPAVRQVSPTIYGQALLVSDLREQPAVLKGIVLEKADLLEWFSKVTEGSLESFLEATPVPPVALGIDLATTLGVLVGDKIRAVGLRGELSPLGRMPRIETFQVVAIFTSGWWQYDANWALIPLHAAQHFVGYAQDQVTSLEFIIQDVYAAQNVADQVKEIAGKEYGTNTWIELNHPLFAALKLEKLAMFIAIGIIVLVASLNIVSTLTLMVMEKNREIAILKAMGGTPRMITEVFVLQGLIIGSIGTVLGSILAAGSVWCLDKYQLIRLDPKVYSIPYLPFELNPGDILLVSMVALVISFLATLYPARAASHLDPVQAFRYE